MRLKSYDSGVKEHRVLKTLETMPVQPLESIYDDDELFFQSRDEKNLEVKDCEAYSPGLEHRAPKLPKRDSGLAACKAEEPGRKKRPGMRISKSGSGFAQPVVSSEGAPKGRDTGIRVVEDVRLLKDRKCGPLGEDAGSGTSHGVEIAKGQIDIVQRPEVNSLVKNGSSLKRKVNEFLNPSNKSDLKEKHASKEMSEKTSKPAKTSIKPRNSFQEEAYQASKYRHKETVAGRKTESTEQNESQIELQIDGKPQKKSKKMFSAAEVAEDVDNHEIRNKSGKHRKLLVDPSKLSLNSLSGNVSEFKKKRIIETSKQQNSAGFIREAVALSVVAKNQTSFANLTKDGEKKAAPLFNEKLATEDLVSDVQTSEAMIAHKDCKPDEVMTQGNSVVIEPETYHSAGLGIIENSVNSEKAEKGEDLDCLAVIGSAECLEINKALNPSSHQVLQIEGGNSMTSSEDLSVIEGKCQSAQPDLVTDVSAKVDTMGAKAGTAVGWVRCDDCLKWRCISTELADMIEATNARWTCLENPDKVFASCSVPQEKSSAQINAELDLSDDTVYEGDDNDAAVDSNSIECFQGRRPATWTLIRRNLFQHRLRKTHDIDDSMVCHCKPPENGGRGCGDNCINRMVCVECVPEICPCGQACANQQFRKRMYAKFELFRCGKKGFGLKASENIAKGTFIVEYVGEVVDTPTFEARQKEYARNGQKHYYFMTLNSNEVIDAHSKGNLGRFINHSCEPNCQTEKWWVDGEICIGLFAIRDLVQGEEITFNYHYEPVYGAAAKSCLCGSSLCQGYIGGESLNLKSMVESDSDGDDPEPVMLKEESEDETSILQEKVLMPAKKFRGNLQAASGKPDLAVAGRLKRKRSVGTKPEELNDCLRSFSQPKHSEGIFLKKASGMKVPTAETNVGRHDLCGMSKSVQPSEVEKKVGALLDVDGGLVKRKDVAEQYMRLLAASAASGETFQEGVSWSVRDLSLLLDAVLKTSSRSALSNVLQKNGLHKLHILIKQSRKTWKRIPILRKLMKVLELLFTKKVLTEIHISSIPSQPGVESFLESIIELTRHDDTEVQQIARRFKAKWLPVGALHLHHSSNDRNLKSQSGWSFSSQPSQQRLLSGKISSPFPEEPSVLQSTFSKFAAQSVSSKSAASAAKYSTFDHAPHANGILEKERLLKGESWGSQQSCLEDPVLPGKLQANTVEQGSGRRNRVSRWDQTMKKDDSLSTCQHPARDAGYEEDQHALQAIGVQESSQSLTNSEGIRMNLEAKREYVGFPSSDQDFRKPHDGFKHPHQPPMIEPHDGYKHPHQPPMPQQSGLPSAMKSGPLSTRREGISSWPATPGSHQPQRQGGPRNTCSRTSHTQPFTGTVPAQQCYSQPANPFQSPQMTCPPAPQGTGAATLPYRQPGPSMQASPHLPHASRQIPDGPSQARHIVPPKADFENLQNTGVRRPVQSCPPAGVTFPSRGTAPSLGFVSGFQNQGEYQLQTSSGNPWPYNAEAPARSVEPFHSQGLQPLSASKFPMHQFGPSAIGGGRDATSGDGDKHAAVYQNPKDEFEPEPPVPGL